MISKKKKAGRRPGGAPFTQREAQLLHRLQLKLRISEAELHRRFGEAAPGRSLSPSHFHRLITLQGKRRPLEPGRRDQFAAAFSVAPDVFETYLSTGNLELVTPEEGGLSDKEKSVVWSEIRSPTFYDAFLNLKDKKEIRMFFRDIMTANEIRQFDKRWRAANLLHDGMEPAEVAGKIGEPLSVVSRINLWLQKGCGGYGMMIERLKKRAC